MPTLQQSLAATAAEGRAKRDPARQKVFDEAQAWLAGLGLEAGALKVGDRAPDFALPDHLGRQTRLSDLLANGPAIVSFYRGGWCPYCNLELRALQAMLPQLRQAGASLVAISPQTPDGSLDTSKKNELEFPVLSDRDNAVARRFGLVFELPAALADTYRSMGLDLARINGSDRWELPAPGTFVVRRDGGIAHAFVDVDYTRRQEPAELLDLVRRV